METMPGRNITADTTKGHAALFYETPEEQLEILAQFFKDGVEQNELCIYVSSQPTEDILEQFATHGFDARPAVSETNLRIFEMDKTYMPNGQFVANYMLHNLQDFIDDAKAAGYHGLRTAGEMIWIHDHPDAVNEAISYEDHVNDMTGDGSNFVGLCLYPSYTSHSHLLPGILSTHPTVIYGGNVHANDYYSLPAA